ncbi:MAG: hypothetical protein RR576_07840 [Oscillospiraceae bacterium]
MNDIENILNKFNPKDEKALLELIDYCDTRVTADEGIPTIIGLDDLTNTGDTYYTPAPADKDMGLVLAAGALVFTDLYTRCKEANPHYPPIALAMSPLTEQCFRAEYDGEDFTVSPYRDAVKDFV